MDETNYNMHTSSTQGRSVRGTRCSRIAAGSKGSNISFVGAIGHMGIAHHEIVRGFLIKDKAQYWFRACLRKCRDLWQGGIISN